MKNLNMDEILRYIIIGLVTIFILYMNKPANVEHYLNSLGSLGIFLVILGIGVLFYQIYHPIFYRFIVIPLKDIIKKDNIRNYIKKKYNYKSSWEAEHFYYLVRETLFKRKVRIITHFHGAGIHLLYMCSFLFLGNIIYITINKIDITNSWFVISILGSLAFYVAGLISDLSLEKQEWAIFQHFEDSKEFKKILKNYSKACGLTNNKDRPI